MKLRFHAIKSLLKLIQPCLWIQVAKLSKRLASRMAHVLYEMCVQCSSNRRTPWQRQGERAAEVAIFKDGDDENLPEDEVLCWW